MTETYRGDGFDEDAARVSHSFTTENVYGAGLESVHVLAFPSNGVDGAAFVGVTVDYVGKTTEHDEVTFYASPAELRALAHELAEVARRLDLARDDDVRCAHAYLDDGDVCTVCNRMM